MVLLTWAYKSPVGYTRPCNRLHRFHPKLQTTNQVLAVVPTCLQDQKSQGQNRGSVVIMRRTAVSGNDLNKCSCKICVCVCVCVLTSGWQCGNSGPEENNGKPDNVAAMTKNLHCGSFTYTNPPPAPGTSGWQGSWQARNVEVKPHDGNRSNFNTTKSNQACVETIFFSHAAA